MGVLLVANEVHVDEERLAAEARAALLGAPPDEGLSGEVPVEATVDGVPVPASWLPAINGAVPMLRIGVFPQWDITDDEANEFAEALAQCLDTFFPGGLDGKYGCFVRLIMAGGGICAGRMIRNGGKLPPLGPKRVLPEDGEQARDQVGH